MKWTIPILAFALVPGVSGCAQNEPPQTPPQPPALTVQAKLSPDQELAKFCRVCVVDKGEKIEEFFPARLDLKRGGKTYKFCADSCKKKFDASPKRYALK